MLNTLPGPRTRIAASRSLAAALLLWCAGIAPMQASAQGPGSTASAAHESDASCTACHREATLSYLHTTHQRTSAVATAAALQPLIARAGNRLTIYPPWNPAGQPQLAFTLQPERDHYTLSAETGWPTQLHRLAAPIDLTLGSGKRGQSYLAWQGDRLFELPVSYWVQGHRWINSPGYPDGTADFRRPILPGCLECHATAITAVTGDAAGNRYLRQSLQPGLGCATCHGSPTEHLAVERQAAATQVKAPQSHILNPATLPRDRQVDLCALCHAGLHREALAPAFSYGPGQPLDRFYKLLPAADTAHPDVHGDQVGLLRKSRCFRDSPAMTCSTCHDVHAPERPAASYSGKCLQCHTWQSCGVSKRLGQSITHDCIRCHMPVEQTNAIVSTTAGQILHTAMRTHWIRKDSQSE